MKNLLSRNEYLEMNEGFKNSLIRGINKIKSLFKLGVKKVKDFFISFDNKGNILPVMSPHALIDHFSKQEGTYVFASKSLNDEVKSIGGNQANNKIPEDNGEIYSDCPKFSTMDDIVDWFENEKYKEDISYKNFLTLAGANESKKVNEDLSGKIAGRISYSNDEDLDGIAHYTTAEFKDAIRIKLFEYTSDDSEYKSGNMLFFGAPGIGKSTIPRTIIEEFNKDKEKKRATLIIKDATNLNPGDFFMPKVPKGETLLDEIERTNPKEFEKLQSSSEYKRLRNDLIKASQEKTEFMPPEWLPVYKKTNNKEIDKALNERANGGIIEFINGKYEIIEEGGGGILMFDELLRADPMIFQNLMNLLSPSREMDGWVLGSKWCIIACTNRPVDSARVADVWKASSSEDGALMQRFEEMAIIEPDPEDWKKYAEKYLHADKMILDYIFDEDSVSNNEYTRWHSISQSTADEKLNKSLSPRSWESIIKKVNNIKKLKGYSSISEISNSDLIKYLKTMFDEDFLNDFITWIENHSANVTIDQIINNPNIKPRINKNTSEITIIKDIWSQVEKAHEKGRDFSDDEMSNLVLWLCKNFKPFYNAIETDFIQFFDKLVPENEVLDKYHESLRIYNAAFPTKRVLEMMDSDKEFAEYLDYDKMVKICETHFPNILDTNGKLISIEDIEDKNSEDED